MHLRRNPEIQPTSADRYKVQFTADAKLRKLIERACALCPDHSPHGQLANVVTRALELFVAQQEKRRFAVGRKPRKARVEAAENAPAGNDSQTATPPSGVKRRRAVKAGERRIVHERDQGRCAWVAKDGRRCAAQARLQLDHVEPWSRGGRDDAPNLRLLCAIRAIHNRLHAAARAYTRATLTVA